MGFSFFRKSKETARETIAVMYTEEWIRMDRNGWRTTFTVYRIEQVPKQYSH